MYEESVEKNHSKFKIFAIIILTAGFILSTVLYLSYHSRPNNMISPFAGNKITPTEKPLDKYSISALKKKRFLGSDISLDKILNDTQDFSSYLFYYSSEGKKVSGVANIPKKEGVYPIIIMFRGYVPQEIYKPGVGTMHGGEVLAQNGFITLAPDFLGYGQSASPSANPMEERFETYTTALTLISSAPNLNLALNLIPQNKITADTNKIGIWGHSNGGHIALVILEATGQKIPTVLWAPVTKPFPYSILYYTDEYDDHGKALRKLISDFEKDYDVESYSLTNYLDLIQAPIELHQGGNDDAVPQEWSDELNQTLKTLNKEITYFTYANEDHNFANGSWSTVIARSMKFYKDEFQRR